MSARGRERLDEVHARLKLVHGSFEEELPEQLMAAAFVRPHARVLELGGNVGRNSCVIGALLDDSANLLVLESDPAVATRLWQNREANGLRFNIEAAALSRRPLVQRGWDSRPLSPDDPLSAQWVRVKTVTWGALKKKYPLEFDTLVVDCEGALYYILKDEPDFLKGFRSVIIENDFHNAEHKRFCDEEFARHGLERVYVEAGGWGPCEDRFYEVWQAR